MMCSGVILVEHCVELDVHDVFWRYLCGEGQALEAGKRLVQRWTRIGNRSAVRLMLEML